MAVSAHEALMNAQYNLESLAKQNPSLLKHPIFFIAKAQIDNVIKHFEANKSIDDEIEEPEED